MHCSYCVYVFFLLNCCMYVCVFLFNAFFCVCLFVCVFACCVLSGYVVGRVFVICCGFCDILVDCVFCLF